MCGLVCVCVCVYIYECLQYQSNNVCGVLGMKRVRRETLRDMKSDF